ncbi:hypothetical protein Ndes2526B_g08879 [Nannochloris sp. 'desiccata']
MNLPSRGQLGQLALWTAALSVGCGGARSTVLASSRPRRCLPFASTSLASSNFDAAIGCTPAAPGMGCPGCLVCKPPPLFGVKAIVTVETLGNDKTGIDKVDKLVSNISKLGKEGLLTVAALAIGLVGYVDGKLDKMDSKLGSKLDKILEIQHVLLTEKALETSSVQILQKRKEENSKRK